MFGLTGSWAQNDIWFVFLQANAIKLALEGKDVPANVYVAMRYWHPFTEEAVHQVIS